MASHFEPKKKKQKVGETDAAAEGEGVVGLHRLSEALVVRIFSFLNAKENYPLQLVCSQWKKLADDPELWRHLFFLYFPGQQVAAEVVASQAWKEAFITRLGDIRGHEAALFLLRLEEVPSEHFFAQFVVLFNRILHLGQLEAIHSALLEAFQKKEFVPMFTMLRWTIKNLSGYIPAVFSNMIQQARVNRHESLLQKFHELVLVQDINALTLPYLVDFITNCKRTFLRGLDPKTMSTIRSKDFAGVIEEAVRQLFLWKQSMEQFEVFRRFEGIVGPVVDPSNRRFTLFKSIVERLTMEAEGSNQIRALKKHYYLNSHAEYWNRLESMKQSYSTFLQKLLKQVEGSIKAKKSTKETENCKQMKELMTPIFHLLQLQPDVVSKDPGFVYDMSSLDSAERKIKLWLTQLRDETARRKGSASGSSTPKKGAAATAF